MTKKVLLGIAPVATHRVDAEGKNHYGIVQMERYRMEHRVNNIHASITNALVGGSEVKFICECEGEADFALTVNINVLGPLVKNLMEWASNFTLVANLKQ